MLTLAVFNTKPYDETYLTQANQAHGFELHFYPEPLTDKNARLAAGADVVCAFVNDPLNAHVIQQLAGLGVKAITLRCAGYNNVDLDAVQAHQMPVFRVPAYSPQAVAEHAVSLMLTLNRKTHKAYNRVREGNFSLQGLVGFDMAGKTVGIIGTGKIGEATARILTGFGCQILAYDKHAHPGCEALGVTYTSLETLMSQSDIISLHCPLNPETHHLINAQTISWMKPGVMLINTSRGGTIDTDAVIHGLKTGKIGYLGLDVYEEEADLFFEDLSATVIQDDVFTRLLTFPNVLMTGHQAFLTDEALTNIAETTLGNVAQWQQTGQCDNTVMPADRPAEKTAV
jgi:D-lactate dehydrogenase